MKNVPLLLATIIGSVALIIGVAVVFSQNSAVSTQVVDQAMLEEGASHIRGAETATVTIVEFSDFQCPACAVVEPLVTQIAAQYPTQVRVVYRHFPLTGLHPYAQTVAQGSEVAAQYDKFWEFHDIVFERQAEWSELSSIGEVRTRLSEYAQEIGIDKNAFLSTIDAEDVKQKVLFDVTLGGELGINSTPTFYVNGQKTAPGQDLIDKINQLVQSN